jgi:hypothetical protein
MPLPYIDQVKTVTSNASKLQPFGKQQVRETWARQPAFLKEKPRNPPEEKIKGV